MTDTIDISDLNLEFRVISFGLRNGMLPPRCDPAIFAGERSRYLAGKIALLGDACSKGLIIHELKRDGKHEDIPAFESLIDRLTADDVRHEEAKAAANRLRDLADGRRLAELLSGRNGVADALRAHRVDDARRLLEGFVLGSARSEGVVAEGSAGQSGPKVITELERRKAIDGFPGFPTFVEPFDKAIGGLLPGEYGLIAGGTGQGKSMSLLDFAARSWERGRNCIYFTIELSELQQLFRLASWGTGIEIEKFRWGDTNPDEDGRVDSFYRERAARTNHLYFVDVPSNVNTAFLDQKMTEVERALDVRFDLVFIDYLGLMTPVGGGFGARTDWDALAEVSWNLHNHLARRREVGVWSAVQKKENISEAAKRRGGIDAIGLSYLIAQPADIVVVYTENTMDGYLEVNIPKGRDTGTSRFRLHPDLRRARIHSED